MDHIYTLNFLEFLNALPAVFVTCVLYECTPHNKNRIFGLEGKERGSREYTLNFECVSYIIFNANASSKIRIYTIFLQVKHIISSNLQLLEL